MPFDVSALASVMGIKPRSSSGSKTKDASKIPVRKPPREKSHFSGLGPSNPIVMAPKQATPDMQPKLGVYGQSSKRQNARPTAAMGLPSGMPPDLGMAMGPAMQPAPPMGMQRGGMNPGMPPQGGIGPSPNGMDPLMKRRMMSSRPAGY